MASAARTTAFQWSVSSRSSPAGRGVQQQGFAECVELELPVGPVADQIAAARISGQFQRLLVRDGPAQGGVGRFEVRAVIEDPGGDEPGGIVEQGGRAGGGGGLPGVALVADPHVPVVVVPAGLRPFGQAGGGRGDHAAAGRGQPAEHRIGPAGISRLQAGIHSGNGCGPGGFGREPAICWVRGLVRERLVADFQNQVVVSAGGHHQIGGQALVPVDRAGRSRRATPAQVQAAAPAGPGSVVIVESGQAVPAETRPWLQIDSHRRVAADRDHPAEQDGAVLRTGEGQCLAAFDDAVVGHPPAAPDHAALFVEPAPDEPVHRGDRVSARAVQQCREDRVVVPPWCAHPHDVAARADDGAAFPVGEQGVFAQHMRREPVRLGVGRGFSGHGRGVVRRISTAPTAEVPAIAALASAARR